MKSLTSNKAFWLLLVICVVTILPFLGLSEYHTKGEPRESIVSYSMLENDNWILPRNNGGEIPYKPPFFHWTIAAVSLLNGGQVTEMTSRMPSAIALIAMTLFGFLFFAKRKGVELALLAAFITLTNFELHRAGANCRVDMVLTALTVCALYCFYKWYEKGLKGIPWLAILLMSLGTLTKGPVGTIIPCLVTGIFLLLRGVNFFRAFLLLSAWALLSLILPICWYIAAYQQGGEEFLALVMEENFGRMTNTMSYDSCVNPWHYNFVTLFAGYVPWILLGVLSLFSLTYRKFAIQPTAWWKRFTSWIKNMDPVDLFSFTSIVIIFVFYCIPQSKRSVYLMPIYPFIAYFLAKYLFYLVKKQSKVIKVYGSILAVISLLLFITFIVVKCGLIPETIFHGRHAQNNINFLRAIQNISGIGSLVLIAIPTILGICWWFYQRKHALSNRFLYAIVVLTMGLYLALDGAYQPPILNSKSVKAVAAEIDEVAPASKGALYEFIERSILAKGDPVHYFEINFYLGNRINNFYKDRPIEGFLLIGANDAQKYLPKFKQEGYQFELLYQSPKPVLHETAEVYRFTKKQPVEVIPESKTTESASE
ncbi:ArnT family glycosyltransferase [Bacteroides faecium]|jgi:4-amino-4-deoxy-L-arabinose transferase-like glycosyltransferase|uniref:Dolichyl-phosphate-mannose--protein mannosyltransferase n=1 Tax=Bacteroides faecium TaxID=2715212 RepID=A0A6H0KK92_9BACE|nr:glycosyltransferase family 39 protein [Bacteroides faecium]QIU93790.1 dolichyl-phosphate-mannose--protein mannosyltransferase [Bacteroides faecium]